MPSPRKKSPYSFPREALNNRIARTRKISQRLATTYPDAHCALLHHNPLQLLIATILSAQCTDQRVNEVTPSLFKQFPNAEAFADATQEQLEDAIRSTGFFRNKSKNIRLCCSQLVQIHDGQVPHSMDELTALAGVGRKTANVVLGNAFGIEAGIVVDTHVSRLSQRLALTRSTDPVAIETDLIKLVPKGQWTNFSHQLIFHGRQICSARKPRCHLCPLADLCPNQSK